jgi:hypothetical protein
MRGNVHLFAMRTATDWESWSRGSNLGQTVFRGENPEPGAYINYYLSDSAARVTADGSGSANGSIGPAARRGGAVTIRITDANGRLVREFTDDDAAPGINRAVWDFRWDMPASMGPAAGQGFGGRGGGAAGAPAVPGQYTATLVVGDEERSTRFTMRGDPNVGAAIADYEARYAAAVRGYELQSRIVAMARAIEDIDGQVEAVVESARGSAAADAAAIRTVGERALDRLADLIDQVQRPPEGMNYRDWPRLAEQLGFVLRGITGAQARPTAGQLEVLTTVEQGTSERAAELGEIINTDIAELNRLLRDRPKVFTSWQPGRIISMGGQAGSTRS